MWAYNHLRVRYFHGVSAGKRHPYLLTSRYGKVSLVSIEINGECFTFERNVISLVT